MPSQVELRQQITQEIVAALENQILPWRRPWASSTNTGRPANVLSKRAYTGVNPLLLDLHARKHGFQSRWWGTFRQWQQLGFKVQKRPEHVEEGHWGARVVFFRPVKRIEVNAKTGEETEKEFPLMRSFWLFNAEQVDGPHIERYRVANTTNSQPIVLDFQPADELIAATGANIRHDGDQAFYRRPVPDESWPNHTDGDFVMLPVKEKFSPPGAYYETAFHELAHWSEVRLGWDHTKHGYEMGELVAEMTACYLSAEVGIPHGEAKENHAAYIGNWLEAMKGDASFIFKAATQASKATDYLLSLGKATETTNTDSTETDELSAAA